MIFLDIGLNNLVLKPLLIMNKLEIFSLYSKVKQFT